jgi:hypothetical protein
LSPSNQSDGLAESRVAILYSTRRWLLLLLISQAWLFAALVGALNWIDLDITDRVTLLISAIALVGGWLLSRRAISLWVLACAPLTLVIAATANGGAPSDVIWIALATSTGHVTYALVLLTRPIVGIASIVAGTIALAGIWSTRPGNVVAGGLAIADGRIQFTILAASALALWGAWHWLLRQGQTQDIATLKLASRFAAEQALQEQSRQWRAATIFVHERLLSTLRYLGLTDEPDRVGLQRYLVKKDIGESPPGLDPAEDLRMATAARIASDVVRLDPSVIDLPLSAEVRTAARAAIIESALNAVLHGSATDVFVSAVISDAGQVIVRISDNGTGIREDATPGFGWISVFDLGLSAVGGAWTIDRSAECSTVVLTLPANSKLTTLNIPVDGFAQGRLLLTAPLLTVAAVGVAFNVLALWGDLLGQIEVILYAAAIVSGAVLVLRGERISVVPSTAILAALAIIPGMTALDLPPNTNLFELTPGLVTAGYAIIAIALWCRVWQFVGALAIWAGGMIMLASLVPAIDRQPLYIGIVNCLVIVPIVVVITSIATRRHRLMQALQSEQREAMRIEVMRSHAQAVIDAQLSAIVSQAEAIIGEIAHGAELDDTRRRQLARVEGLLRATIQIDPISSGEFAKTASRLCNAAFNRGIPSQVGTLISSPDPRPFPADIEHALELVIASADTINVRAVTSGDEDHIGLHLHGAAVHREALHALTTVSHESVTVELEEDATGGAIVMITRACIAPISLN